MMRASALALCALTLAGCGVVSFRRHLSDDERRLEREVRGYYAEVRRAFAAGNPQALASLFDAGIAKPMTKPQIEAWAEKFFSEHGRAAFRLKHFELLELGLQRAVVEIDYAVEPSRGTGGFGGRERDELVKKNGRWYTAAWEKLP